MSKYPIKMLLCILTIFVINTANAIVIRHDQDDAKYQQLAKQYKNSITYNYGCVGTVIDTMWVLTAAHCVEPERQRPLFIEHLGKKYPVEFISIHPKFEPETNNYDMALLRLKWPMEHSQLALLYHLPNELGKKVTFVGNGDFGNGLTGLTSNKAILRAATNIVTDSSDSQISFVFDHPDKALTLEGISGPHDSGGPAFIENQGKLYIAGVSSWQSNQGKEGIYGVIEHYARVSTQRNWINSTINNNKPSPKMEHLLLCAIQSKAFQNLKPIAQGTKWKQSPTLVRELLVELLYKLSPQEARQVINQIPTVTSLKLNDISLPIYVIEQENWPLLEILMQFKLNINEKNVYGESFLTQLVMLYPQELSLQPLLSKLLEQGLDIDSRDERGNTALALAVYLANRDKNYARVKLLLKNGANPDIGDFESYTPLMYIASVGNEKLMSLFIKHGVNLNIQDNTGKTALDYAASKDNQAITQLIKSANQKTSKN